MKHLLPLLILFLLLTSCHTDWKFTPRESKFFNAYNPGDTLFFLSSKGERDTFCVADIESELRTGLGFFGNQVQNDKNIFIKKIPIDSTQFLTSDPIIQNKLTRRQFLSAHKRPKENKLSYCIRFKDFESCSTNFGNLVDNVNVDGVIYESCYIWKNQFVGSDSSGIMIDSIYWTLNLGMVAYKQFDGTVWIRKITVNSASQ